MEKPPEIKIIYKVIGDHLPFDKISELAGRQPDRVCHKGDLIGRPPGIQRWKWDFWRSETIYTSTWSVDEALGSFLAKKQLPNDSLTLFCKENQFEQLIALVIYMGDHTPSITLEPGLMAVLSHHNIALDFDMYLLPSDEPELGTEVNG